MFTLVFPHFLRESDERLPEFDTPALNQILRFARLQAVACDTACLYQQYLCDQLALPEHCVYASPLNQQVGMNNIVVQHGEYLAIQLIEAKTLCDGLNQFYGQTAQFTPLRPDLWQVTLASPVDWAVESIFNLKSTLNSNHAPNDWLQFSTEVQMWLHSQTINQNRTPCSINAVWFWNAPDMTEYIVSEAIATDSVWSSHSSQNCQLLPSNFATWKEYCVQQQLDLNQTTVFSDAFVKANDAWEYAEILAWWESQFFMPIWRDICSGSLKEVRIVCENYQVTVSNQARLAFWKRLKQFNGQYFKPPS